MTWSCKSAFVTLSSSNFAALVQFYRSFLLQEPVLLRPDIYAEFHLPDLRLGIFKPKFATHPQPSSSKAQGVQRGIAICLEVADLEKTIAHLTAMDYPPPGEIKTASHGREIDAFDPDGNWLILHQGKEGG